MDIDFTIFFFYILGDEAASFTKEEMQQGKHTEYEKNLHEELSMNSSSSVTTSTTTAHPANSVSAHSESSIVASSSNTPLVTSTSARDSVNSSSPSGIQQQQQQVVIGSGTVQAPNGRATSENSDKISSRSPSPVVHHQITNGGWPNLGMDSKKNRYVLRNSHLLHILDDKDNGMKRFLVFSLQAI